VRVIRGVEAAADEVGRDLEHKVVVGRRDLIVVAPKEAAQIRPIQIERKVTLVVGKAEVRRVVVAVVIKVLEGRWIVEVNGISLWIRSTWKDHGRVFSRQQELSIRRRRRSQSGFRRDIGLAFLQDLNLRSGLLRDSVSFGSAFGLCLGALLGSVCGLWDA